MFNIAGRTALRALPQARAGDVARNCFGRVESRSLHTLKDRKYTAHATAKAVGQLGQLTTPEGVDQTLALPKALGGTGKGQNPEQLLAMGYAACLLEAIRLAARALGRKDDAKELVIHTSVHIGEPKDLGGFGFAIDIEVEGVDEELLQRGHEECPYSRALKDNVEINVRRA